MDKMCVLCVAAAAIIPPKWFKMQYFVHFLSPGSAKTDNG